MSNFGRYWDSTTNWYVKFDGTGVEWDTSYLTRMFWINRDDYLAGTIGGVSRHNHSFLHMDGSHRFRARVQLSGGGGEVTAQTPTDYLTSDRWYHVAMTNDGTTLKLRVYDSVTGVVDNFTIASGTLIDSNADLFVGPSFAGGVNLKGSIAAVKHWQHTSSSDVLTDAQIDAERWSILPIHRVQDCLVAAPLGLASTEPNFGRGSTGVVSNTLIPTTQPPVVFHPKLLPQHAFSVSSQKYDFKVLPLDPSYFAPNSTNVLKNPALLAEIGEFAEEDSWEVTGVVGGTFTGRDGGGGEANGAGTTVTVSIVYFDASSGNDYTYDVEFDTATEILVFPGSVTLVYIPEAPTVEAPITVNPTDGTIVLVGQQPQILTDTQPTPEAGILFLLASMPVVSVGQVQGWLSPSGLNVEGFTAPIFRMRVRRTGGIGWRGNLYYANALHGFDDQFKVTIPDTTSPNAWTILEFDLSHLTDYIGNTVDQFRIELGATNLDTFDVDWVVLGRVGIDTPRLGMNLFDEDGNLLTDLDVKNDQLIKKQLGALNVNGSMEIPRRTASGTLAPAAWLGFNAASGVLAYSDDTRDTLRMPGTGMIAVNHAMEARPNAEYQISILVRDAGGTSQAADIAVYELDSNLASGQFAVGPTSLAFPEPGIVAGTRTKQVGGTNISLNVAFQVYQFKYRPTATCKYFSVAIHDNFRPIEVEWFIISPPDNLDAVGVVPTGVRRGTACQTSIQFGRDESSPGVSNAGEISITAGVIVLPDGSIRPCNRGGIFTPWDNFTPTDGVAFLFSMPSDVQTRFGFPTPNALGDAGGYGFFTATYDRWTRQWTAWNNVHESVDFTPNSNDICIGVMKVESGSIVELTISVPSMQRPSNAELAAFNPGFDLGDIGWPTKEGEMEIIYDPLNAYNGVFVARRVSNNGNSSAMRNGIRFPCTPGQRFRIEGMVKSSANWAGTSYGWRIAYYNSVGSETTEAFGLTSATTTWTKVGGLSKTPAGAVNCRLEWFSIGQTAGTVYADAANMIPNGGAQVGDDLVDSGGNPVNDDDVLNNKIITFKLDTTPLFTYDGTDYQPQRTQLARYTYNVGGTFQYQNGSASADANREFPWLDCNLSVYAGGTLIKTLTFRNLAKYGSESSSSRVGSLVRSYWRSSSGSEPDANFDVDIGANTNRVKWDGTLFGGTHDVILNTMYGGSAASYTIIVTHTPSGQVFVIPVSIVGITSVAPIGSK